MADETNKQQRRVPLWMLGLIILFVIPGCMFPWLGSLLSSGDTIIKSLTWFYPLYVLASAFIAWQCYGRRTLMTWIILTLLLLTHFCFYYLAFIAGSALTYR
jgi:hypothetical protein